jgi:hypothetical protein
MADSDTMSGNAKQDRNLYRILEKSDTSYEAKNY